QPHEVGRRIGVIASALCASSFVGLPFGLRGAPRARLQQRLLSPLARRALPREPPPGPYVRPREQLPRRLGRLLAPPLRVLWRLGEPLRVPRSWPCGLRSSLPGPLAGRVYRGLLQLL